jgi:hypothetical protein
MFNTLGNQPNPPVLRENVERPEFIRDKAGGTDFGVVQKPLTAWEKLLDNNAVRKIFILIVLALIWEIYARVLNNSLLFPTFTDTLQAFFSGIASGGLIQKSLFSIKVLLMGYAAGVARRARFPGNTHFDVQSIAGDRAIAAGAAVVRPWNRQPGFRADSLGRLGSGAEHALRFHVRQ